MWSLLLTPAPADFERLLSDLWERGTAGIWEEADGLRAFFSLQDAARQVEQDFASIFSGLREEPAQSSPPPAEEWEPVLAGANFVIVPKGSAVGSDFAGRFALEVNAGMAFGSGRHESTQLCIEALEALLKGGETVIDVGCGSGILSLAAKRLGAINVIACDIQEDALRTARDHFDGAIFQGSADALREGVGDIVLANISARIDDRIASDLRRVTSHAGLVIASGFTREKVPECFQPTREWERDDWLCWACTRDGINSAQNSAEVNVHPADWWV